MGRDDARVGGPVAAAARQLHHAPPVVTAAPTSTASRARERDFNSPRPSPAEAEASHGDPVHVDAARPDTGLNNGKLGIWLFLASEVMLFGALFATYIICCGPGATDGPTAATDPQRAPGVLNTLVLIGSSVTMVMAWASLMRNRLFEVPLSTWA